MQRLERRIIRGTLKLTEESGRLIKNVGKQLEQYSKELKRQLNLYEEKKQHVALESGEATTIEALIQREQEGEINSISLEEFFNQQTEANKDKRKERSNYRTFQ